MTFTTKAAAYFDGDLTSRTMPPFASRAAAEAATILPNVAIIEVLFGVIPGVDVVTLRYRRAANDAAISALATNGGAWKWTPDGEATILHYGGSPSAPSTVNSDAMDAAMAQHSVIHLPRVGGTYNFARTINVSTNSQTITGDPNFRSNVAFDDTFDGPCFSFARLDRDENSFRNSNGLHNLNITGGASVRAGRWAVEVWKQEAFRMSNVRWSGFSYGLRIAGGQQNEFTSIRGAGSGLTLGNELSDSTHLLIEPASNGDGSFQAGYTCRFEDLNLSGGGRASKNVRDIITIKQSDGHHFDRCYITAGARSLLMVDPAAGHVATSLYFDNVYFDGVDAGASLGTPHGVYFPAAANVNAYARSIEFNACNLANYSVSCIQVDENARVQSLRFIGGSLGGAISEIGTIRGRTTDGSTGGLALTIAGTAFRNSAGGLKIIGARSIALDAVMRDIGDAAGAVQISGTVRSKWYRVTGTGNAGPNIVDTSTGLVSQTQYEFDHRWTEDGWGGATDSSLLSNFEVAIPAGVYRGNSSNGSYNGPDTTGWGFICEVTRGESGRHWFFYRRASGTSPRTWIGFRLTETGAVTWSEIITAGSVRTSITSAPPAIGLFAVVGGVGYISTGTAAAGDWKQITT